MFFPGLPQGLLFFSVLLILLISLINFCDVLLYEKLLLSYVEILIFAVLGTCFCRGDYFRRKRYLYCFLFLIWIVLGHWFKGEYTVEGANRVIFVLRCALCGLAFPFAHVMADVKKRKYLNSLLLIVVLIGGLMLCLCFWGMLRGENISLLNGYIEFGVSYNKTGRMMIRVLNVHYYQLGYFAVVCFFISLYLIVSEWNQKIAFGGGLLLLIFAVGVFATYSRTGVFSLVGGSILAFALFLQNRPIKRQVRWFVLCMSIILGTVITCAMMNYIYEKVHSIRNIWYGITTLSSRTIIWRSLVDVFQDYPQNLIYGFPYNEGMAVVNKYLCSIYDLDVVAHMHSGYLQTFLYTGFPGFVAVIIFAIYVTWVSGKLFLAPAEYGVSLEEKMLVLIPVICFIMNLVESVLFYNAPSMEIMNMLVMLCSGYILEIKREKMPNC